MTGFDQRSARVGGEGADDAAAIEVVTVATAQAGPSAACSSAR